MNTLANHFPTGCWHQPDDSYAGECSCGHTFHEPTYAAAKQAWANHAAPPVQGLTSGEGSVAQAVAEATDVQRSLSRCNQGHRDREHDNATPSTTGYAILATATASVREAARERIEWLFDQAFADGVSAGKEGDESILAGSSSAYAQAAILALTDSGTAAAIGGERA